MLLQKIKLSGFKSFVDPTPVLIPSSLVGIVGPNGCGKSNVIDAVRWVMGESAASQLRGESLTDVIFKGSSNRQPVNQASVELHFDNSDMSLGGEYASYAEIVIRREVSHDGLSNYYLNGTRCRRKDISGVFLGTGLGPRSYSIIQQGTVSRLIEAKPEELRQYLEEAAGISKYKERRKETAKRIRHTRENLERLADIRMELEKQLAHLQRQANAAERFKVLQHEQTQAKSQCHALKWQAITMQVEELSGKLETQETGLQQKIAKVREVEANIESSRVGHAESIEVFNEVQSRYYQAGGEIGKIEQTIKHQNERNQQLNFDFEQAQSHWQELSETLDQDREQIKTLEQELVENRPQLESANEQAEQAQMSLEEAQETMYAWQERWNEFSELASKSSQVAEVEQSKIRQYEERIRSLHSKIERAETELSTIEFTTLEAGVGSLKANLTQAQQQSENTRNELQQITGQIDVKRNVIQSLAHDIDNSKRTCQKLLGQQASLEALQEAALGQKDSSVKQWLETQSLSQHSRLAQKLQVRDGWDKAVETVLGDYLQAVCVDDALANFAKHFDGFKKGQMSLVLSQSTQSSFADDCLAAKVTCDILLEQLANVYIAETLEQAIAKQATLASTESVITRDGVWLGKTWARISREKDESAGVISREQDLRKVRQDIAEIEKTITSQQEALSQAQEVLDAFVEKRDDLQEQANVRRSELAKVEAEIRIRQSQLQQVQSREQRLQKEITEQKDECAELESQLEEARLIWQDALSSLEQHATQRDQLNSEKESNAQRLQQWRDTASQHKHAAHQLEISLQSTQTRLQSLQQTVERLAQQFNNLNARKEQLEHALSNSETPLEELEQQRQALLEQRVVVEEELNKARILMNELDGNVSRYERERHSAEDAVQNVRGSMEGARLEVEGLSVRRQTISEQLEEMGLVASDVLEAIEEPLSVEQLEEQLAHIERRISRLGPINLAAIDEYEEKAERKAYLDSQDADLESALTTLENAMDKIDRETRQKFKDTYETVNASFKILFPKIFGGGSAFLELTGTDLLDTGVTVMAHPPGKKNSTIHLLSGGEKTMTAIALVFSIFQLNPSPFCMLDEVDAPLDDANVVRFCNLVKEMSAKVQFIVITHNKVTMEMMHQLMGVTMHEPGVSRIVSVDVEQAAVLAEA